MPATAPLRAIRAATSTTPRDGRSESSTGDATRRIADAIVAAIVERRLMPGTKLAEQKIADIFKVSRTLVRQALNQLSRDQLVTLERGRGARVARPSVDEARQVFEVRRVLEAAMIRRAANELTAPQVKELRAHLKAEQAAVGRLDVSGRTRLLADFHVVIAGMLGNEVLAVLLGELVSRSSLIALMYQSADSAGHSFVEHVAIVDAIDRGDARAAARLMEAHLTHVVEDLRLDSRATASAAARSATAAPPAAAFA